MEFAKSKYRTINYIQVFCDYSYNSGTVYFDDIQLTRNSIETNLTAEDFVVHTVEEDAENEGTKEANETAKGVADFEELRDSFGNALTETTFTDGEFGTIYRAFEFNQDDSEMPGDNSGNDLICETDARGNQTRYQVDGDTSRNEEVTDRCGNKTAYVYDMAGRTTKVISKDAEDKELANVSYAYDSFDNMTEIMRGDGLKYVLQYNAYHNLESIGVDGMEQSLVHYAYKNGNGRLKAITYANGDVMKASYNSAGQMIAERWYDVSNTLTAHYKYVYDGQGNIVRSIDLFHEKEYNYTYEDNKLVRAAEYDITLNEDEFVIGKTVVATVMYSYDSEGKLTRKRFLPTEGKEQSIYYETAEDDNTVVKFTVGGRTITSHSKSDAFGRKVFDELQFETGFASRQFSYHAGQVTETHVGGNKLKSSPTTQLVERIILSDGRKLSYEYDKEERITKVTDSVEGVTEYTYDALGQLLTETRNDEVVNTMTYDNYGNILAKNGKTYTYSDSAWKDRLTAVDGQTITYDAQGNPINYQGHSLTWEKGRQLKSFDGNTYTYNANGIRTIKTVNGVTHTYILDGTNILRETWGDNELVPMYDNEDNVCGIIYNDSPFYFLKNLQGDVITIIDKYGKTVAEYSYDAWGACTIKSDTSGCNIAMINPYRYRSYYYDTEIGMYYLQSRYYDPSVGRFLNADEEEYIISSQRALECNQFSYCECDPVNNTDENGGISLKKVLSIFNSIAKYAKKIISWMQDYVNCKLKFYTNLSPSDISAIAKNIKRSPHRVRQALQSLNEKWTRINTQLGKIARALAIIGLVVSVSYALSSGIKIFDIIAYNIVNGFVEFVKWLVGTGLKKLISLVPAVGALLGFALGKLIGIALNTLLPQKFVQNITKKYISKVNHKTYKAWDYFTAFFKCWT